MNTNELNLPELLAALQVRTISWADFVAEIAPSFRPPLASKAHDSRFRQMVRYLSALNLADEGQEARYIQSTADLNLNLVVKFINSRPPGQSPHTLKGLLLMVQNLCSHAVKLRYLAVSPFAIRPIGKIVRVGPPQGKRHITREEIRRLFQVLAHDVATKTGWGGWKARRLQAVVALGLYCGLRKMELLMLHVADVHLQRRVIRLTPHNASGRFKTADSAQPVPIVEALAPILSDWLAHRLDHPAGMTIDHNCPWLIPTCDRKSPWISGHAQSKALYQVKAAGRRAGIPDLNLSMLRKSLATHLESHGVGGAMIQRILRHTSSKTTETFYRRPDEANIAAAVADFDF